MYFHHEMIKKLKVKKDVRNKKRIDINMTVENILCHQY